MLPSRSLVFGVSVSQVGGFMCNKMVFQTKKAALVYARFIFSGSKRRTRPTHFEGKKLAPYGCPVCGLWHLTSKKKVKTNKTNAHYKRVARK